MHPEADELVEQKHKRKRRKGSYMVQELLEEEDDDLKVEVCLKTAQERQVNGKCASCTQI